MAPCISDKQGGRRRGGGGCGGGGNTIKGVYAVLGAVARQFSIGMVCYTRTAINYGYFIALTLEKSSRAL